MKAMILVLLTLVTLATNATAGQSTREENKKASECNLLIRVINADADSYGAIERYKELGCKEVRGLNCIVDVEALGGK